MGHIYPIHSDCCIHKEMGWCAEVYIRTGCRLDRQSFFTLFKNIANKLTTVLELQNRGFSGSGTILPTDVSYFFCHILKISYGFDGDESDNFIGLIWKALNEVILQKILPNFLIHMFVILILTKPSRLRRRQKIRCFIYSEFCYKPRWYRSITSNHYHR